MSVCSSRSSSSPSSLSPVLTLFPAAAAASYTSYMYTNRPLIWVECLVERPSRSRTDYVVKARSQFKERSVATNVEIILPLPNDATAPVTRCSQVRGRERAAEEDARERTIYACFHGSFIIALFVCGCAIWLLPILSCACVGPVVALRLNKGTCMCMCVSILPYACRGLPATRLRRARWSGTCAISQVARSTCCGEGLLLLNGGGRAAAAAVAAMTVDKRGLQQCSS